jgi:hypothetical protein
MIMLCKIESYNGRKHPVSKVAIHSGYIALGKNVHEAKHGSLGP